MMADLMLEVAAKYWQQAVLVGILVAGALAVVGMLWGERQEGGPPPPPRKRKARKRSSR